MKHIYFSLLILFLSGCTSQENEHQRYQLPTAQEIKKNQDELVIDLNASSNIIINSLRENNLASFLSPEVLESQETIDTLIKNFSPAQMAFEAEVLNFKDPVIILYYDTEHPDAPLIMNSFLATALANRNRAKFVKIDVKKFFSLADYTGVMAAPTIIIIYNREEKGRTEEPHSSLIETEVTKLLQSIVKD